MTTQLNHTTANVSIAPLPRFTRVRIVGPDKFYAGERGKVVGYSRGYYQVRLDLDWRTNAPTRFGADEVEAETTQ